MTLFKVKKNGNKVTSASLLTSSFFYVEHVLFLHHYEFDIIPVLYLFPKAKHKELAKSNSVNNNVKNNNNKFYHLKMTMQMEASNTLGPPFAGPLLIVLPIGTERLSYR